jgi:hypothetical protein
MAREMHCTTVEQDLEEMERHQMVDSDEDEEFA